MRVLNRGAGDGTRHAATGEQGSGECGDDQNDVVLVARNAIAPSMQFKDRNAADSADTVFMSNDSSLQDGPIVPYWDKNST